MSARLAAVEAALAEHAMRLRVMRTPGRPQQQGPDYETRLALIVELLEAEHARLTCPVDDEDPTPACSHSSSTVSQCDDCANSLYVGD